MHKKISWWLFLLGIKLKEEIQVGCLLDIISDGENKWEWVENETIRNSPELSSTSM